MNSPKKRKNGGKKGKNNKNLRKIQIFTFLRITFFYQSKRFCRYYRKNRHLMKKTKVYSNVFDQ